MLGSYGLIDFMTLLIATQLIVFAANLDNGFTILIVSESIWLCLYTLYLVCGTAWNVATAFAISPIILVLAAVDCSIWVLVLVYLYQIQATSHVSRLRSDVKFLYRSGRMLRGNRFIK